MHVLAEWLPFAQGLSQENSEDSYLCFQMTLLYSVSQFVFFSEPPYSPLCTVFAAISFNIGEFHAINPSVNVFAC